MSHQLVLDAFKKNQTEMNHARRLAQHGELMKAEKVYIEVLNQEYNYPPALYGLAELANQSGDQDKREQLLRKATDQIKKTGSPRQKVILTDWLTELAEILITKTDKMIQNSLLIRNNQDRL